MKTGDLSARQLKYPNESAEYRSARNQLLAAEIALRKQIENVAKQRRALPPGGKLPEDYVFERIGAHGMPEKVKLSELFGRHQTLILYSFMYGADREEPCPMCVQLLESMNGVARHVAQRAALCIVAKSPIARLVDWARRSRWEHLQFLSTAGNRYTSDYFGDSTHIPKVTRKERWPDGPEDEQWDDTIYNVFRLDNGVVRHFWGSELTWAAEEPGMDHRSGDFNSALWGLLDITPEGRGQFMPKLAD